MNAHSAPPQNNTPIDLPQLGCEAAWQVPHSSITGPAGRGAALAELYIAAGPIPFACSATSKRPAAKGWQTLDVAAAREQFARAPSAMVGLDCERHGLVVVDCDNKGGKTGSVEFRALCAHHGVSLVGVPSVRTPSGGEHFVFRAMTGEPVKSTTDKLGLGVDTRAKGGFVIAAGSVRRDGGVYQPVYPADLGQFIARIADPASLPPFPSTLAGLVGAGSVRPTVTPQANAAQPSMWPQGMATPSSRCRVNGPSELSAGLIENLITDLRGAALALVRSGKLNERDAWRNLVLFPFTALTHQHPKHEPAIKAVFDEVSAESAAGGANVKQNDAQWQAQMTAALRTDGRTIASTFAAAGEVNAAQWAGAAAPPLSSAPAPAVASEDLIPRNQNVNVPAAPPQASVPPSPIQPPNSLAFGGTALPAPRARKLDLMAVPPHRLWILGYRLLRGEITILAAPGGRGKSAVAVAWACSLSAGRKLVGEYVHGAPKRVLYISTEDSTEELNRRFYAAAQAHGLTPADLANVRVMGVDIARLSLTMASERGVPAINPAGMQAFVEQLTDFQADVVILDPLGPLIPVGLNDNGLVASLMAQLKSLAVQRDFALLILHHFKKGSDGTAEAVGGASAIVNFARAACSIETMSEREGSAFGILPSERWRHLRVTDLKVNLAPPADAADWLTLSSVTLPNAAPPDYPLGESVQAVVPFVPPPIGAAASMLDTTQRATVEAEFTRRVRDAQTAGRAFYCTRQGATAAGMPVSSDVLAEVLCSVTGRALTDCKRLAEPILTELMARGVVMETQITTANRHKRRGLVTGPNAPNPQ